MLYTSLAVLVLAAYFTKDKIKHRLACFMVAMPIFHCVVNNSLTDWQYYHIAFIEEFTVILAAYIQWKYCKADLKFNLLIALSAFCFMGVQCYGWFIYPASPISYNNLCYLLYAVQILILFTSGGAANELTGTIGDIVGSSSNRSSSAIHLRNGGSKKCKD